jgi:hypothetical protein
MIDAMVSNLRLAIKALPIVLEIRANERLSPIDEGLLRENDFVRRRVITSVRSNVFNVAGELYFFV